MKNEKIEKSIIQFITRNGKMKLNCLTAIKYYTTNGMRGDVSEGESITRIVTFYRSIGKIVKPQ